MKKYHFLLVLFLIILSSFSITDIFYKKTYVYKNISGASKNTTTWLIKKKKDGFDISKTSDYGITDMLYSPKYQLKLIKYSSTKEKIDYKMVLEKNKLFLSGSNREVKPSKTYFISDKWVQDFNFGLREFLESKMSELKFITVNPKDFTTNQMVATKEGIQKIKINENTYNTQKVQVTLRGFKSLFWKAEIWYDLETFDLVRYRANEGPGTPVKTIILDSKK